MEHITIIDLGNDMVKLIPDKGYILKDSRSSKTYTEAVVENKEKRFFSAVEI